MKVIVFLLLAVVSCQAATWQVQAKDLETIIIGISFVNETTGWVPGDQNGVGALFLRSDDGGKSWKPCTHDGYVTIPMGIAMERLSDGTVNGVIGGVGIGRNFTSMEYTTDGKTFHPPESDPDFVGAGQDAKTIHGIDHAFALAGSYVDYKDRDFNGLAVTYDGGHTWSNIDIGYEYPIARYGHFPTPTTWFVAAGEWPALDSWDNKDEARVISQRIRIHKEHGIQFRTDQSEYTSRKLLQTGGYAATISRTTDGGKTWQTVYNDTTGSFYFNDIDCPTAKNCWAVGEAESDSPRPGIRILHSGDGGNTWQEQLYIGDPTYSLIEIAMLNETEGWAAGAVLTRSITGQFYHTTDGGKTWTTAQTLSDEYALALDLYQPNNGSQYLGWGTAITLEGKSSILIYN